MAKKKAQVGGENVASGNDQVGLQIGRIGGAKGPKAPKPAKQADVPARVENVRSGDARVGRQVDEVQGDVTIRFGRNR